LGEKRENRKEKIGKRKKELPTKQIGSKITKAWLSMSGFLLEAISKIGF
jgi:hypothetical protein